MPDHVQPAAATVPPHGEVHGDVRFERKDANLWVVLGFCVVLVTAAMLAHLFVHGVRDHMEHAQVKAEAKTASLPPSARATHPRFPEQLRVIEDRIKGPALQVNDIHDMRAQRRAEDALLQSYGWTDRGKGRVRIPIDVALRIFDDPAAAKAHGIAAHALKEGK